MPLNETLNLNITEAQRQISLLERQLDQLSQPVNIPVNVSGGGGLDEVRRDLDSSEGAADELNRELAQTDELIRDTGREARRTGDDLEKAGRKGASAFGNLGTSLATLGAAFVGGAAIRGFLNFANEAITSASNLEQSVGALDAVFGDLGDEVAAFGDVADQSVGLAASQFNQLASVLGSQLQTFGFNVQDAARETQNLIILASDLAATFGGPVSQAVEAISSLLRGEVNPIERYGVAMNETSVQARALEDGLGATADELTFQDKTMARLAILYDQTANAQGQFGRESETTAGQLERFNAAAENTRAEVGQALTPVFLELLEVARDVTPVLADLAPIFGLVGEAVGDAVTTVAPFIEVLGRLAGPLADILEVLGAIEDLDLDLDTSADAGPLEILGTSAKQAGQDIIEGIAPALPFLKELRDAVVLVRDVLELPQVRTAFATAEDAALLDNLARVFKGTGEAAEEAAEVIPLSLDEVGSSLTNFINGMEGLDRIGQIEFENPFRELPTGLDAAAEAIKDTEGEILSDFSTFLENLEAELAAQRDFADNIASLFELGFDSLGQFFLDEGIESAGLLADGLTDPAALAQAEAALDEAGRRQAIAELDAFVAELEGQLDGVNLDPIPIKIISDFTGFILPSSGGSLGVGSPISGSGGSSVTVNNVYNTPPPPTTEQARTAQITSSIITSNAR